MHKLIRFIVLIVVLALSTACGPAASRDEQALAGTVAPTQTLIPQKPTLSAATPLPTAPPPTTDQWPVYTNPETAFTLHYPPDWQQAALPPENDGARQGVQLSGPQGTLELWWGTGFDGACPQGTQPIAVINGTLDACYTQNPDGTESWEQMGKLLGDTGFMANAKTLNSDPASRALLLNILSTLSFPASSTASSPAPATHPLIVRLDPAQARPAKVAIYAEIPGEGPHKLGDSYFTAEGDGTTALSLDLPAAGYLIYAYSLDFEDLSYFGAWLPTGGQAFIDSATVTEVVLQRPLDPCNPDYQLQGSPDGRFLPTSNPEILTRFGCNSSASPAPIPGTAAGATQSELAIDMRGTPVYLQLDADEAPSDPATGDLAFSFSAGIDQLQAVNGARLLPMAPDSQLADCLEPNAQLFNTDAIANGLKPGAFYCAYTSGGRVALVEIQSRVDIPQTSQSSITVNVKATEKGGVQ